MRFLLAMTATLLLAGSAIAQQGAPPPDQTQPPNAGAPADDQQPSGMNKPVRTGPRQPNPKRVACMDKARQQGLRGPQMRDAIQLCVEEARLSCTKQAIEKNIAGAQRRDFIKNCAG